MKNVKKALGIMLSAAMVSSALAVPASAATVADGVTVLANYDFNESSSFYSNGTLNRENDPRVWFNAGNLYNAGAFGNRTDESAYLTNAEGSYTTNLDMRLGSGWNATQYALPATMECSFYTEDVTAGTLKFWVSTTSSGDRVEVRFENGSLKVNSAKGGDASTSKGTYKAEQWNKLAVSVESESCTKIYLNGDLVDTLAFAPSYLNRTDVIYTISNANNNALIDDFKVYQSAYDPKTDTVTDPANATNGVITVEEGTTVAELKADLGSNVAVYADDTYAAEATEITDDTVVVLSSTNGEVYKYYTVGEVGKYDDALFSFSFDNVSEVNKLLADTTSYPASVVSNVAGRSDSVAYFRDGNATGGVGDWGAVFDTDVMTVEALIYNPNKVAVSIYPTTGGSATTNNRLGINLAADGTVSYMHNSWTPTSTGATYNQTKWTKVAYELDSTAQTMKIYVDGVLAYTYSNVGMTATGFAKDLRVNSSDGYVYMDSFRAYPTAYKGDDPITVTGTAKVSVSGTTLNVLEGSTLADVQEVVGTDAVFYTDSALTTTTTTLADGIYAFINKGEIYACYEINIAGKYDGAYKNYDFSETSEVTSFKSDATQANGVAGKDSSDKVAYFTGTTTTNWGAVYSGVNVVTAEVQVYSESSSNIALYLNSSGGNSAGSDRTGIAVAGGKVKVCDAGSWTYPEISGASYNADTWVKIAVEWNRNDSAIYMYVNGELVNTVSNANFPTAGGANADIVMQVTSGAYAYVDNFRVYPSAYKGDETITAPDEVTDGAITVVEGTSVDTVKAYFTDDVEIYTDSTFATVATEIASGNVSLVNKGELYAAYAINVVGKYEDVLFSFSFDDVSEVEKLVADTATNPASVVTNMAGRSDSVAYISGGNADNGVGIWGAVFDTEIMTVEAMIYNPNNVSMSIYPTSGGSATTNNRLGINLAADGTVGYMHNSWTAVSTGATYDQTKWTKVAYELDSTAQTMKIYVDGVLVYTYSEVGMTDTGFAKDLRIMPSGYVYMDNLRAYAAAYKGDDAVDAPSALSAVAGADASTITGAVAVIGADGKAVEKLTAGCAAVYNNGELYKNVAIDVTAEAVLTALDGAVTKGDTVSAGFVSDVLSAEEIACFNTILAKFGDNIMGYSFADAFGTTVTGGDYELGILITEIPTDVYANGVQIKLTSESMD